MSRKLNLLTVLVMVGTILLSACQPAPTPEVIEKIVTEVVEVEKQVVVTEIVEKEVEKLITATPEPVVEVEKPKGKIVLWGWSYDVMQSTGLIDEFKAEYPDIEIEIVTYNAGDTYQNLQLACSASEGAADVVQVENSHLAGYVNLEGCLVDLTDQIQPVFEQFNQYKWKDAEKDGKYYAVPWDSGPVVMYYRRDVFEGAGLPTDPDEVSKLVATWDSYLETCKAIKDATGRMCFAHSKANNDARLYEIALWQRGLGYYDAEGKVTVASPENIAMLEKLGEFWTADVTSEEVPWTDGWYAELQSMESPIATIVEASWLGVFLKTWIAGDTAGKWGVAYMPAWESGQPRAANDGGSTLVITEQSQNKEAAMAFIEFMLMRRSSQLKMFAYSDFLPSLETTYDDHLFIEPDPFFASQVARKVYLDVAKQIPPAYVYGPYYSLMHGHLQTAIQKYATGEMSAEEALNEAADAIRLEAGME
ncbi:MAG: sugar ABC transporter substrate-binding protein [Anaerolineales bacterium]|nr:sugar ABC transporter substrate-binding protein [Anaerolineales bacterium]